MFSSTNPPDAVRRYFQLHMSRFKGSRRLLVACSGGPDSVALTWLLRSLETELGFNFVLAHVNHSLRGRESDKDAEFVRRLGDQLGWPVRESRIQVKRGRGNLEERARVHRYNALFKMASQTKCSGVLTAHTMDDQAETILMNMLRGSGGRRLGGMPDLRA